MKWLRPGLRPAMAPMDGDASLDDVGRMLEAAALEAPPSPRADVIRARLVATAALAEGGRSSGVTMPILRPLAVIAALLLIVALAIGAPAIGSFIDGLTDDEVSPPPPVPSPSVQDADASSDAARALGRVDRGAKAAIPDLPTAESEPGPGAGGVTSSPSPAAVGPSTLRTPAAVDVGLPIGPPLPVPWPTDLVLFVEPILPAPTPAETPTP